MNPLDPNAQANADLQHAEAQAAALLAELEAKDAANATAASVVRDPVKSVAASTGADDLADALNSSFKPVNLKDMGKTTLASSHTVDFAQKIKDAQKFHGNH
jgi:hypothetical protein